MTVAFASICVLVLTATCTVFPWCSSVAGLVASEHEGVGNLRFASGSTTGAQNGTLVNGTKD